MCPSPSANPGRGVPSEAKRIRPPPSLPTQAVPSAVTTMRLHSAMCGRPPLHCLPGARRPRSRRATPPPELPTHTASAVTARGPGRISYRGILSYPRSQAGDPSPGGHPTPPGGRQPGRGPIRYAVPRWKRPSKRPRSRRPPGEPLPRCSASATRAVGVHGDLVSHRGRGDGRRVVGQHPGLTTPTRSDCPGRWRDRPAPPTLRPRRARQRDRAPPRRPRAAGPPTHHRSRRKRPEPAATAMRPSWASASGRHRSPGRVVGRLDGHGGRPEQDQRPVEGAHPPGSGSAEGE